MAEPPVQPNDPQRAGSPAVPPDDLPTRITPKNNGREAFLGPNEPTDDSPTIISRATRRTDRPEDGFIVNLRGRTLAHFELIEPIGIGGMAAVIRAFDNQLERHVALKILPPEMATDPENIRRFQQEARAAAKLDHENIARVFYCGEDQGLHFIAFEFVEGENLRTILERRGRLLLPESINYMLQVATGLAHASARSVVHRDIKPSNIIISPNGRAKLVDMGLARSLEPRGDGALTQSGVTLGTFDYISPEQALEPRDADVRSDIYSLGCTFYHMLTGQPPVPEGTAAKKLHHHQHIAPIDPRQFNADIPDEVAAILARMMAKDVKNRYQRPEHLVQHLIAVAHKLGTATDVPEGVLFVDAPLPGPPRARPILMGFLATAVLVGLVALLGSWGEPEPRPDPKSSIVKANTNKAAPPPKDGKPLTKDKTDQPKPKNDPPVPPPGPNWEIASNADELAKLLKKPVAHVSLAGNIDLTRTNASDDMPGLIFQGTELIIRPDASAPDKRPTIRLKYDSLRQGNLPWVALTIKSGKATLQGVRFEIDAKDAPNMELTALSLQSGELCTLEGCEFIQKGWSEVSDQRRLSAIAIEGMGAAGSRKSSLLLKECYFKSGPEAILLPCTASIRATNCAFGPHHALFHVRRPSEPHEAAALVLDSCSALLENGSAFQFDENASGQLTVKHCLFSRPETSTDRTVSAVLIRQTGEKPGDIQYDEPMRNGYHNLRAFYVKEATPPLLLTSLEKFLERFQSKGPVINNSVELTDSPWQEEQPLKLLEQDHPELAFKVNEKLKELRQVAKGDQPIGVERCTWGASYLEKLAPPVAVVSRNKIVDPTISRSSQDVYPTLGQALGDAQPGDVIRIRHTGRLEVEPVVLNKATVDLTIKPYSGHAPVLTLGGTTDPNAALFTIHDGQLTLEDLQFRLKPGQAEFKGQAVLKVVGAGQGIFKRCVATLEKAETVKVALVVLADPNEAMKMGPPSIRTGPILRLENCFIRGDGDLVYVRASRQFNLQVEQSLVALNGSFLVVLGNPKDPPDKPSLVTLKNVTAFVNDYLVWLQACKEEVRTKGLVLTQVMAPTDCLFATENHKALVHFDDVDTDEQMRRCLTWSGGKHNAYSGFGVLIEQQPRKDEIALEPYNQTRWEAFTNESGLYTKVRFAVPQAAGSLLRALPTHFKVLRLDAEWQAFGDCGADVDHLPKPFGEDGATALQHPED